MRSKKTKKKILVAVVLALLASMGIFGMINGQKASIEELNKKLAEQQAAAQAAMQAQQNNPAALQETITTAVLAKVDIKTGDLITFDKIEKKEFKKTELPAGYFVGESMVIGKTASQDILQGKVIESADVFAENQDMLDIPPGMRAITIPTDSIQGLTSYIFVGTKIDILKLKSPPEYIAQNVKIVAFETNNINQTPMDSQPTAPAEAAPAAPVDPAAPPTAPVAPVAPTAPAGTKKISALEAKGITVLVPTNIANNLINAMLAGKLQILARGKNDNKIVRQRIANSSGSSSPTGKLPPPPKSAGSLPSLPVANPPSVETPPPEPKVSIEIIKGSDKTEQTFGDSGSSSSGSYSGSSSSSSGGSSKSFPSSQSLPSDSLKDLLKLAR